MFLVYFFDSKIICSIFNRMTFKYYLILFFNSDFTKTIILLALNLHAVIDNTGFAPNRNLRLVIYLVSYHLVFVFSLSIIILVSVCR